MKETKHTDNSDDQTTVGYFFSRFRQMMFMDRTVTTEGVLHLEDCSTGWNEDAGAGKKVGRGSKRRAP